MAVDLLFLYLVSRRERRVAVFSPVWSGATRNVVIIVVVVVRRRRRRRRRGVNAPGCV